jgi:tetratricopeptide (TPR) repeat protein
MRFRKTLTLLMLMMGLVFALPTWAQQKPLTQDQVQSLLRSGLGDESGARLIEQRGIDFAPAEDFLQSLKATGASEAFLKALRAAMPPEAASAKKPLNQVQVFALLAGGVPSHRVAMVVKERGIDFEPQQDYLDEVRIGGGDNELIAALHSAKVTKPVAVDPTVEAPQADVPQQAARGTELFQRITIRGRRGGVPRGGSSGSSERHLHIALSCALNAQRKTDEALAEAREALRLNPGSDLGHFSLGNALRHKGDLDGAKAEYREALRLNPNDEMAHHNLGLTLGNKGDWDGAIAEYREALRLNPSYGDAHNNLGVALENKGDRQRALEQYRAAYMVDPTDSTYKQNYERLFQQVNK